MLWRGGGYCGTMSELVHSPGRGTVRYSGYAGKVHCARWYGTVGALVRYSGYGGTARGTLYPTSVPKFGKFSQPIFQFSQPILHFWQPILYFSQRIFGNTKVVRWRGTVGAMHCTTVPSYRTTAPYRTWHCTPPSYHTTVPYSIPYPAVRTTNLP